MTFTPRRRKSYIRWKNGRPYYRRVIPARYRDMFDRKTEWVIPLKGSGNAELEAEAAALAHQHNKQLSFGEQLPDEAFTPPSDAVAMRVDLAPENAPPGQESAPVIFTRDGQVREIYRFAITDDPAERRKAEADGFFVMTTAESKAQLEFHEQLQAYQDADSPERREIADLKGERAARQIEAATRVSGETVLSILPRWHDYQKQAATTWKKHSQYATEFAELHGDLPLSEVTKRRVVEYVEHAQTLTYRGEPLSPTSITKRLDSIRALLAFAVHAGEIEANPAAGVKPPKDNRPKTARSWKSFTTDEIKKLAEASTEIWTNRRDSRQPGRREDLMTALQVLIWTGARPEEVCQLRRDDVDLHRGVVRITNDESDDGARARLTKNEQSIREVPLHSRLTPVLTEHLRHHNSPLLFPTFEPQATPAELAEAERTGKPPIIKGRYARPISREWTDNLRAVIAPTEPRKVLYSLRHSWAAESRRTGMPEHVRNAIMGHANDNPHAGRYGGDAEWLEEKRRWVERLDII